MAIIDQHEEDSEGYETTSSDEGVQDRLIIRPTGQKGKAQQQKPSELSKRETEELDMDEFSDDEEWTEKAIEDETVLDRLMALRDIIPPARRSDLVQISSRLSTHAGKAGTWIGRAVWVLTTSALLVVLPLTLVLEDEAVRGERALMQGSASPQEQMSVGLSCY